MIRDRKLYVSGPLRWLSMSRRGTSPTTTRMPVVLVHGFRLMSKMGDADTFSILDPIGAVLERRGHQVHRFSYSPRDDLVDTHANHLAEFIAEAISSSHRAHTSTEPSQASNNPAGPECVGSGSTTVANGVGVAIITHSFGGVIARAALNTVAWRAGWGERGASLRCVLFAPPNMGSSLARAMLPGEWDHYLKGWSPLQDAAKVALDMVTKTVLGEKAGMQLAQAQDPRCAERFGGFPAEARVLVIAGDCGEINPLLVGSSDGVVTVGETYLSTPHLRMTVSAPHNLICMHPAAVRAAVDFVIGGPEGSSESLVKHPGYLASS